MDEYAEGTASPAANDDSPEEEEEDDEEEAEEEEEEDAVPMNANVDHHLTIAAVSSLESHIDSNLRDLSSDVVCWQLSSAKPGNGVEQVRDSSLETYWQSDGQTQPHWMQVHFVRRVAVSHVCLYLDYSLDESYTPKKLTVEAGMTHQDLWPALPTVELQEPSGWCILPLQSPPDPLDDYDEPSSVDHKRKHRNNNHVRAHVIRISIQSMHQNGRDTHVRQLRLFGPRMNSSGGQHYYHHSALASPAQEPMPIAGHRKPSVSMAQLARTEEWFMTIR